MRPGDQNPVLQGDEARLIDEQGLQYGACVQDDRDSSYTQDHNDDAESSLPPVDGGPAAWGFLAACWAVEALVFGESSWPMSRSTASLSC